MRQAPVDQPELERLHAIIRQLLEGPWSGTEGWARSLACAEEGHPRIHDDPARECYCRLVKP